MGAIVDETALWVSMGIKVRRKLERMRERSELGNLANEEKIKIDEKLTRIHTGKISAEYILKGKL